MIARATLALAATAAIATGCRREPSPPPAADAAADSVTGTVAITGTSFEKFVVLRGDGRTISVVTKPADTSAIYSVAGAEIVAHGTRSADGFHLSRFRVSRVDGAAVIDGYLADSAGVLILRTPGATRQLGNPPAALRALVGSRVWIGGPLTTGPYTYGIIR